MDSITVAIYVVLILLIVYFSCGMLSEFEPLSDPKPLPFQMGAGFFPEVGPSLPKPSLGKKSNFEGATGGGPDDLTYSSNETEEGNLVNLNQNWSEAIKQISLTPDVIQSHKKYMADDYRFLNRGSAAPNLPIREDDQVINKWVGLTGAIYCKNIVKDGSRVVPTEDYNQLRKGSQLRWRSGYDC
jgi:hypothetical protein